ncbi:MAG: hypothetical protein ACOCP4_06585 [Candidatus Woesearchaeota archaeon]
MAHPSQCYNCKKFAKEISRKRKRKTTYRILKCKNCGEYTLSSISYYLAVWGEMEPSISIKKIEPESELWKKYFNEEE